MKKLIHNIIFLFIVVFILINYYSCFRRCNEEKSLKNLCTLHPQMENYFAVFKPGNWWIYENTVNSKKDSMWIDSFNEYTGWPHWRRGKKPHCYTYVERNFNIMNKISDSLFFEVVYYNRKCDSTHIVFRWSPYYNQSLECWCSTCTLPNCYTNTFSVINVNINNISYSNVLFTGTFSDLMKLYFAPGVGIIRYTWESDTFDLINYHIQ